MIQIETIKYTAECLRQANWTKNQIAWRACQFLSARENDISLKAMADLFGIERFRLSRMNQVFTQASHEMIKALQEDRVPLNVAYKISSKVPVKDRDKALAEYLAAPKGAHGRRNPKPGLIRGNPQRAINRSLGKITTEVDTLHDILDQKPACFTREQQLLVASIKLNIGRLLKRGVTEALS